ncbi:MAG: sugar phosphate isomerase/epimerase family protein, partial [Candidatus Acidiferrales bacterium]
RSLHSPLYRDTVWGRSGGRAVVNIAELEPGRRQEAVDEVLRALEVAERIPFRFLVQHVGDKQEDFAPKKFDTARASLDQILPFARARGVEVLLENIPNELSSPARLRELIEKYSLPALGVCFDTGHAHLGGGVEAAFEPLRDLVRSTHIHDNNGQEDDHLFPLQGSIEWDGAMRALGTGTREFPLQLEVRDTGELADPLEKALESYRRLEELVPAPRP